MLDRTRGPRPGSVASLVRRMVLVDRGRRELGRVLVQVGQVCCMVASAGIPVATGGDPGTAWIAPLLGVALPVLRAPDPALPGLLRIRSRARRAVWRVALLLAGVAGVCAAAGAGSWAVGLGVAGAALFVGEPVVWVGIGLAPSVSISSVDAMVADARAVEQSRRVLRGARVKVRVLAQPQTRGLRPFRGQPFSGRIADGQGGERAGQSPDAVGWRAHGELGFDGTGLRIVDALNAVYQWPVTGAGIPRPYRAESVVRAGSRPVSAAVGEDVGVVAEIAVLVGRPRLVLAVFLLDAESRRLAEIPLPGLSREVLLRLSVAAGLSLRAYRFEATGTVSGDALYNVLFPFSPRYRPLCGPEPEFSAEVFEWP